MSLDFSPNGCQVWVTQSQANTDTVFTLNPCLATASELPNTGVDTAALAGSGTIALAVLAAGTALVLARRRSS